MLNKDLTKTNPYRTNVLVSQLAVGERGLRWTLSQGKCGDVGDSNKNARHDNHVCCYSSRRGGCTTSL